MPQISNAALHARPHRFMVSLGMQIHPSETALRRVLFVVAHPYLRDSRSNRAVVEAVSDLPGLTLHRLYDLYPYFHIEAEQEREKLLEHDLIVVQHPFYWFSMPSLMKQWLVEVLQPGWAYGTGGDRLKGKDFLLSMTVGGPRESYSTQSYNRFPFETFLAPWDQTVHLCQMNWHDPLTLFNTIHLSDDELRAHSLKIRIKLEKFITTGRLA